METLPLAEQFEFIKFCLLTCLPFAGFAFSMGFASRMGNGTFGHPALFGLAVICIGPLYGSVLTLVCSPGHLVSHQTSYLIGCGVLAALLTLVLTYRILRDHVGPSPEEKTSEHPTDDGASGRAGPHGLGMTPVAGGSDHDAR